LSLVNVVDAAANKRAASAATAANLAGGMMLVFAGHVILTTGG
jgi:hypothetical protein